MQCKELQAVLEQEEFSPLPHDAQEHLAECSACREMLADLAVIVESARQIPAEAEPPQRLWVSVRAQLEAEGIIHEPEVEGAPVRAPWWSSFPQLWRPRVWATVGAALFLVAGGAYLQKLRTGSVSTVSPTPVQPQVQETAKTATPPAEIAPRAQQNNPPVSSQTARANPTVQPPHARESNRVLLPSPSEDAGLGEPVATMNQMEGAVSTRELADNAEVDASFRDNLRTLNAFIAECEARLKKSPRDRLTREYLNMALRQKAQLLTAMMDSGRSEN